MSLKLCPGGFAKLRDFASKLTNGLSTIISDVTDITGKIKSFEGTLTAQIIVGFIPNGSMYESALNNAMDKIVPTLSKLETFAEKVVAWLDGKTQLEKNASLLKLASTAVSISDNNQHPESFYDTATQVHIEGLK